MPTNSPFARKHPALLELMGLQKSAEPSKSPREVVQLPSFVIWSEYPAVFFEFEGDKAFYDMGSDGWTEDVYYQASF